jgi:hypothetical protein
MLDGNIGIGGRPDVLLSRVRQILSPGGAALVETGPEGTRGTTRTVRLEVGTGAGPWFELTAVAFDDIPVLARDAGFALASRWSDAGRYFAHLVAR